jgi:hypothetical protein
MDAEIGHLGAMRPIGQILRSARASSGSRFTRRSDLWPIIVRMISMNSLAAFTAEVSRMQGAAPARAATSSPTSPGAAPEAPRRLDALPPPPATPMPRGSLLDLRV